MLCLANSERIKLTPWVHMVFEVEDLLQASPATVSRCGMVYVDPEDLGWQPLVDTWKIGPVEKKITAEQMTYLYHLFMEYFQPLLRLARKHGSFVILQVTGSKVRLFCELLSSMLELTKFTALSEVNVYKPLLAKMFAWGALWSIASNFRDAEKETFEGFIREVMGEETYLR